MLPPLRGFAAALLVVWALLLAVAIGYSHQKDIPWTVTAAVVPAFLVEAALYLAAGVEAARERIAQLRPPGRLATWLFGSALLPFLLYTGLTGTFAWVNFSLMAALFGLACFWFVALPRSGWTDLGFVVLMAAFVLAKVSFRTYPTVVDRVDLGILGHITWVRVGVLAVLLLRRLEGVNFSFLPTRREWAIGVRQFLLFLPLAALLATTLEFARFRPASEDALRVLLLAVALFPVMLWVQAVPEEFFFRGLLQQSFSGRLGPGPGLLLASVLFGLAHLGFRHQFPNWRFAVVATLAGVFYGLAYRRAGSIRAAMVTHALVVTTWKVLFTG